MESVENINQMLAQWHLSSALPLTKPLLLFTYIKLGLFRNFLNICIITLIASLAGIVLMTPSNQRMQILNLATLLSISALISFIVVLFMTIPMITFGP